MILTGVTIRMSMVLVFEVLFEHVPGKTQICECTNSVKKNIKIISIAFIFITF